MDDTISTANLFTYGTLMCEDIMRDVTGLRITGEPCTLHGYSRWSLRDEPYPGLIPDKNGIVKGVVYLDIPDSALARLDRFEGAMYERGTVTLTLANGANVAATAYIVQLQFIDQLEETSWDYEFFLRKGKELFQNEYKRYTSS